MNRFNIAQHVVQKLNVPSLIEQSGDFVQRNYEMIYDKANWRDVEFTYTVNLPANTNLSQLDSRVGRIASVRAAGRVLDPINAVLGMQFDPTIFERHGQPEVYEEIYDPVAKANFIKVYPRPVVDTELLVVGIRKISQLANNEDVPSIRNIDNCLIAFTEADMLERLKQYGMANGKRQEADAKLQDAIAMDSADRSNFLRQIKPMTVSGGTLAELVDAVCARAKSWAPETRVLVTELLRRNYVDLYDMTMWRESQMIRLVSATGGSVIVLPHEFDSVISVRQDEKLFSMLPSDINYFFAIDPTMFDMTNQGTPSHYVLLTPVGTPVMPDNQEPIRFTSSAASDRSYVFISGENAGVEQHETVLLNGTDSVVTTLLYDTILTVGKELTNGDITISGDQTNTIFGTLPANERARTHIRIRLFRNLGEAITVLVHGKRRCVPLVHDHDKPLIRGCGQALVYMTTAEVLAVMGGDQAGNAQAYSVKSERAVRDLMDREVKQSSHKTRIVPIVDGCYT